MKTGISDSGLNLTQKRFRQLAVPVAPRPEQHRIVEAIESYLTRLDDAAASLERVQRNLERYRASVLKSAVEGRLVLTEACLCRARHGRQDELAHQEGCGYERASQLLERILADRKRRWIEDAAEKARAKAEDKARKADKPWSSADNGKALEKARKNAEAKYKEPAPPETTDLPDLPEGWCWTTAEALSDETRSITYGVIKLGAEAPSGVKTLRSSNVRNLRLDCDYVKPISPEIASGYKRTLLRGGEVLVTVRGSLGGVVVAPDSLSGYNISREVAMIDLVDRSVAQYAATAIAAPPYQVWLMRRMKGITYRGINIETLKNLPLPLAPLREQLRIVETVERNLAIADSIVRSLDQQMLRCSKLRQSILKWAFEGKLVEQNPDDEPASELLERIKARQETKSKSNTKKAR